MAVGILNACLFFYRLSLDPVGIFSSNTNLFTGLCWFIMLLLTSVDVIHYFWWYRRAKRAAETDGSFLKTTGLRGFHTVILVVILTAMVSMLLSLGENHMWIVYVVSLGIMLLAVVACVAFSNWLKRRKVSAKWNRVLTYGVTVCISFGIAFLLIFLVVTGATEGWLSRESDEGYRYSEKIYLSNSEELPLTIGQLMGQEKYETEIYKYGWYEESSPLMGEFHGIQNPRREYMTEPWMEYTVWTIHLPILYDWCLEHLLEPKNSWSEDIYGNITYDQYRAVEASPWGAKQAYRLYQSEYAKDRYLLCFEDQIIEIRVDWELTKEQMSMIKEILVQN